MKIWKRFLLGALLAVTCVGGWDYAKHVYVLKLLRQQEGLTTEKASIGVYRKGFCIYLNHVSYEPITAQKARVRIPFWTISRAIVWAEDVRAFDVFESKQVKFLLSLNQDSCVIKHFYMKNNTATLMDMPITCHMISGHGDVSHKNITYTLHATMLSANGQDLSTLTSFGGIEHPFDHLRKGALRFKFSQTHPILQLLTDNQVIKNWQMDLLMRALGNDVVIPIDLRGTYVYMGPIKIADLA